METLKKLLIFQEMKHFNPAQENFFYFRKRTPRKNYFIFSKESFPYISGNGNPEYYNPKNKEKKSVLKTCLVSYDVFTIFTSVEHMEIPCEAKNKRQIKHYK